MPLAHIESDMVKTFGLEFTIRYLELHSNFVVVFLESHFKDNPALSMLNDSEDEVVYGLDI